MTSACRHEAALAALMVCGVDEKSAAVDALAQAWREGRLSVGGTGKRCCPVVQHPGRPDRPVLVPPQQVPRRRAGSRAGQVALLHAIAYIAYIDFNAINLALDCVYRFRNLPEDFHAGWVGVAREEALHFRLVRERLRALGHDYGDLSAHNGLWEMACRTAHDPLARMALVPRVLEARGLDATPPIMAKLRAVGDDASCAILDIILRDEVGHVALGDRWFRHFCAGGGWTRRPSIFVCCRNLTPLGRRRPSIWPRGARRGSARRNWPG